MDERCNLHLLSILSILVHWSCENLATTNGTVDGGLELTEILAVKEAEHLECSLRLRR